MADKLEGRNPVMEAIKADRPINKIMVSRGVRHGSIKNIISLARQKGIPLYEVDSQKLDSVSESFNHQGVIAYIAPYSYYELEDILHQAKQKSEHPLIICLDEIQDPYNFGSILRTADAVGAHGVITLKRRAVQVTPVVAKASAGAVEHVPVARVTNLAGTLDILKKEGMWVVGADMSGETLFNLDLRGPLALVIGNEGKGLSRLVREKCDFVASLPMRGKIDSLNAAVAASVMLYEITRQRLSARG